MLIVRLISINDFLFWLLCSISWDYTEGVPDCFFFLEETVPLPREDSHHRGGFDEVKIPHSPVLSPKTSRLLRFPRKEKKDYLHIVIPLCFIIFVNRKLIIMRSHCPCVRWYNSYSSNNDHFLITTEFTPQYIICQQYNWYSKKCVY